MVPCGVILVGSLLLTGSINTWSELNGERWFANSRNLNVSFQNGKFNFVREGHTDPISCPVDMKWMYVASVVMNGILRK